MFRLAPPADGDGAGASGSAREDSVVSDATTSGALRRNPTTSQRTVPKANTDADNDNDDDDDNNDDAEDDDTAPRRSRAKASSSAHQRSKAAQKRRRETSPTGRDEASIDPELGLHRPSFLIELDEDFMLGGMDSSFNSPNGPPVQHSVRVDPRLQAGTLDQRLQALRTLKDLGPIEAGIHGNGPFAIQAKGLFDAISRLSALALEAVENHQAAEKAAGTDERE